MSAVALALRLIGGVGRATRGLLGARGAVGVGIERGAQDVAQSAVNINRAAAAGTFLRTAGPGALLAGSVAVPLLGAGLVGGGEGQGQHIRGLATGALGLDLSGAGAVVPQPAQPLLAAVAPHVPLLAAAGVGAAGLGLGVAVARRRRARRTRTRRRVSRSRRRSRRRGRRRSRRV